MSTDLQLADVLGHAERELVLLAGALGRALEWLSEAPDAELRTTAKALGAFQRSLRRHREHIAQRAQLLQLELPRASVVADIPLLKELHAFGREHAGVALGELDVWAPLNRIMPEEWRRGFMFMGVVDQGSLRLYEYKHGITRHSLALDAEGKAYCYDGNLKEYVELADVQCAVEQVFADLERFDATRETAYDAAYRQERDNRLARAGFDTLSISDRGVSMVSQREARHGG